MAKPFKTIDQQIEILRSRGLLVEDSAYDVLLSENYYSVVNGYKEFFIDKEKSSACSHEMFLQETCFSDVYELFLFDRALREYTFHNLIKAESLIKTVSVYTFCERFPEPRSYLDMDNYTARDEYMLGKRRFVEDLPAFVSKLNRKAYTDSKCKDFIQHYRDKHGDVPLWVLANDLTFGNISYFFNLQKRSVQNEICRRIVKLRGGSEQLNPKRMRLTLRALVDFRNICAHDERLFCAKVGPVRDIGYADMLESLAVVLPKSDVQNMRSGVLRLINDYSKGRKRISGILDGMGIKTAG
ncbi:Abi family protein [Arabiibacter massiliensis]|uniref:Abi family protein n=1 Tax=Arabiibacter massiliensis TaxID=1870985 RepID=UPI0009BB1E50|nr:Abi family protein [Arabiibacter massiliensis]